MNFTEIEKKLAQHYVLEQYRGVQWSGWLNDRKNEFLDNGKYRNELVESLTRIEKNPQDSEALYHLGIIHILSGFNEQAVDYLQKAYNANPKHTETCLRLGMEMYLIRKLDEAIYYLNQAIKLDPKLITAYEQLYLCLCEKGQQELAIRICDFALSIQPNNENIITNKLRALHELGRMEETAQLAKKYSQMFPNNINILQILIEVDMPNLDNPIVKHAKNIADNANTPIQNKIYQAFNLANIFHHYKDYPQSFRYLHLGNKLKFSTFLYKQENEDKYFNSVKQIFSDFNTDKWGQERAARLQAKFPDAPTPIFILGMPRSGTSLVEQILASHSQVYGAGELSYLPDLVEQKLEKLAKSAYPQAMLALQEMDEETADELAILYLHQLRARSADKKYITDKLPDNFAYVGLIRALLPQAIIIHCERDAMDTCFSIYQHIFSGVFPYAYDQASLGYYYKLYEDLMQFWNQKYPEQIHNIQYETLVDDFYYQAKKMLDFCGLEWEENCREFHKTKRDTRTASASQVVKPLYKSSVAKWRNYEAYLTPLKKALGIEETGEKISA